MRAREWCVWRGACVCLQVRTRKMPPQPHPPCEKCRLAESARRSTIGRLRSGARPTQSGASRTAGSAYGGGISRPAHSVSAELREALWRRTAGYRARIRRKARNPAAPAQRGAWSEYLPSRRASAIAASCASRRLRLLRLVSPPPRLASRKVGARAPRECKAHGWRRSRGASGNACADIMRIARAGWAALTTGPERILRRDAQDAARRRCRAQGERARPIDQAMQGAFADGLRISGKAESAVAEWRAVPEPPTRPCQPRAASPPTAERPLRRAVAERGGRTRRQSSDCRAVRTDAPARSAQGEARLGRSGAHAVEAGQGTPYGGEERSTRHRTHNTRMKMGKLQIISVTCGGVAFLL